TSGAVPPRQGNAHLQIVPYELFATADGWLVLAVGNDGQWQAFCHAAGAVDLAADARYLKNAQRVEKLTGLVPQVAALMRARSQREWLDLLTAANVPHAEVWNYATLFEQDQVAARGMKMTVRDPQGRPVDLLGSPFQIAGAALPEPRMPPELGQDTD